MDDTPFVDVIHLFDYWAEHPPLHILVGAFLRSESKTDKKPKGGKKKRPQQDEDYTPKFFGNVRNIAQAPAFLRNAHPDRERRFAKLKEFIREVESR